MKSFKQVSAVTFGTVIALFIVSCGPKETHSHAHGDAEAEHDYESEAGVTFNAKRGLFLPSTTAKFIGLQMADVEERKIVPTFQFPAQVYRASSEVQFASLQRDIAPTALASGNVSPEDAARLTEGQSTSIRSADGGVSLQGRVVALKRDLEKASGQVEVLLAISDISQPLGVGAFISATVLVGGEKSIIGVRRSALFRTTEGDFVYTASGEHFVRTLVKLGHINQEFAEVTDGLYVGDQIVVRPVMTLWMAELQSVRGGKSCTDGH